MRSSNSFKDLKVALVHDYLREYGGAERVLEALHHIFPDAPLYVSFVDSSVTGIHWSKFKDWQIHQSWLRYIPGYKKLFSPLRIFAPNYFQSFDLSAYDVVISSTNAYFAKAVRVRKGAIHLSYCHTPARSLYGYSTMTDWESKPVTKFFGTFINHYLRVVDVKVAQKVTQFIANSREVQQRIHKFYHRDSIIIYPPVNVPPQLPAAKKTKESEYYLYVNRLAFAKHPELAVQACNELGLHLKVVGDGALLPNLKDMAGPTIEFLGAVDDDQLGALYAGAKALLYPVENEDFGIVPVEAMGHGLPVLAHRSGGPQETIIDDVTGLFFDDLTIEGMKKIITDFEKRVRTKPFNRAKIHQHALKFNQTRFAKEIREIVQKFTSSSTPRS